MDENDRLMGWKAIAAYLDKGVRTAQRWERELGLPVHRLGPTGREVVFASKSEIEEWLTTAEGRAAKAERAPRSADARQPAPFQAARRILTHPAAVMVLFAVTGALAVAGYWSRTFSGGPVATVAVSGGQIQALNAGGRVLWSDDVEGHFAGTETEAPPHIALIDENNAPDVVAVVRNRFQEREFLRVYRDTGKKLFDAYGPAHSVTFGNEEFLPPFPVNRFVLCSREGSRPVLWAAFAHTQMFPVVVGRLGEKGELESEYWASGHLQVMLAGKMNERDVIWLGGTDNLARRAALTVVDQASPNGSAPSEDPAYRCRDCPTGDPLAYVTFPSPESTELTTGVPSVTKLVLHENGDVDVTVVYGMVVVGSREFLADAYFKLDRDLRLKSASWGHSFEAAYRGLWQSKLLRTPCCPDPNQALRDVKSWVGDRFTQVAWTSVR